MEKRSREGKVQNPKHLQKRTIVKNVSNSTALLYRILTQFG